MSSKIAMVALVIILGLVNWSIIGKEKHLREGRVVYLDLVPVDPRSIMQGDYMALRFRLATEVSNALPKINENLRWWHNADEADGYVVVSLDEKNIGSFKRLGNGQPLSKTEMLMRYRVREGAVKFATNAFFFQEGRGEDYQSAHYGQFRVDDKGELLLVAMYGDNLKELGVRETE